MYEPQFRCRSNGVPILSHEDIESDAEMFIRDFDPDVLNNPKEVNIEEFAEFYLGLTPEYNNLTHCGLILEEWSSMTATRFRYMMQMQNVQNIYLPEGERS